MNYYGLRSEVKLRLDKLVNQMIIECGQSRELDNIPTDTIVDQIRVGIAWYPVDDGTTQELCNRLNKMRLKS